MKPYVLVIVDMQNIFIASRCERTRENIIREIKKAKKDLAHIVVVEYRHSGPTYEGIIRAIGTYRKAHFVSKTDDDGSLAVVNSLLKRKSKTHDWFRLCGVNIDCCIAETALGLRILFPKADIEIIMDASNTEAKERSWHITRSVLQNHKIALRNKL